MNDKIPIVRFPVEEIKTESKRDRIDDILGKLIPEEHPKFETIRDQILETRKCDAIIALLEELNNMYGERLDHETKYKITMIRRDLKMLNSPIWPADTYHASVSVVRHWHVFDIEREYLNLHVLQGKKPEIMPKVKYTKREVYRMLNMLMESEVIYNYESKDLFVNDFKGELNSYFRNNKKIRVKTL